MCNRPPVKRQHDYEKTRASWNYATALHNQHKGDQAQRLRQGWDPLFPEELDLLGPLAGRELVHLQCNSGQDSLALARHGANVVGVDFSDEAIAFAQNLARESQISARFECSEVVSWCEKSTARFDLAFSSYGAVGWLPDVQAWARGIANVLKPGASFIYVEFHPVLWSVGEDFALHGDSYFLTDALCEPVGDYVANSGTALGATESTQAAANSIVATSWQHTLGDIVSALAAAGLRLEVLREYPYANGCRVHKGLVAGEGRRWHWPSTVAAIPLMFGLRCTKSP
jgi:2-polyprenyl-3-methyl-5-hydroxy-6-metoxy-1,4-benzoquinol methylase